MESKTKLPRLEVRRSSKKKGIVANATKLPSGFEKAEDRRFKSFPRNIILKLKDHISDPNIQIALACNYRKGKDWNIVIYLNKFHKNTGYKKIAEKINNYFLQEFLCSILRINTKGAIPPCEIEEFSCIWDCPCGFPIWNGMRLNVK